MRKVCLRPDFIFVRVTYRVGSQDSILHVDYENNYQYQDDCVMNMIIIIYLEDSSTQ